VRISIFHQTISVRCLKRIIIKQLLVLLFVLSTCNSLFSQNNLENLKNLYRLTENDSLRLKALLKIAQNEENKDTVLYYLNELIRHANSSTQIPGDNFYQNASALFQEYSMYDEAIDFLKRSAEIMHAKGKYYNSASDRLSAAYIVIQKGLYKEAIEELTYILDYTEKFDLKKSKERVYLLFGFAYRAFDFERALKYFNLCMDVCDDDTLKNDLNYALNEIGNLHVNKGEYSQAREYHLRALKIREAIGSPVLLSFSYHDIASCFNESGNYDEALDWFFRSVELTEEAKDWWGLSITYNSIAKLYRRKKAYSSAESYLLKALDLAKEVNMKPVYQAVYLEMYELYQETEDYKRALHYYKQQKYYNDSIFEEEKQQNLKVLESRFESLQKDKEITEQKEKLNKQKILMYFGIVFITLLIIVGLYIYRQFLHKRRLSRILAEQNSEIESQRDEILSQRDEIASQRDQVMEQKNQIHGILTSLTSSIRYAETIQQAILPSMEIINESGFEYFLIYRPSEIVSGDFYWSYKFGNTLVVAVADCTGHGVPGAFMSMLGITLLKEIIVKNQITNPHDVLSELRNEIVKALHQEKGKNQRDGMDIALCTINLDTLELHFAGANNPLYIVTGCSSLVTGDANQQPETSNQQLVDKMPIGIYERMIPFTLKTCQLQKGDYLYLFSDGYADQFGGASGKKIKYKPFQELLLANSNKPEAEQKEQIEKTFIEWKGNYKQVDDVTILGRKI